ncbi:MAG TPA: hypothetical protein VFL91_21230 [Thermomicrobiales bacterium]|nr:hypothetical protein [Thermomicrobiales bacterium]
MSVDTLGGVAERYAAIWPDRPLPERVGCILTAPHPDPSVRALQRNALLDFLSFVAISREHWLALQRRQREAVNTLYDRHIELRDRAERARGALAAVAPELVDTSSLRGGFAGAGDEPRPTPRKAAKASKPVGQRSFLEELGDLLPF